MATKVDRRSLAVEDFFCYHVRFLDQRVHRNAIVNVNHVRKMSIMSSQRWLLTLSNLQELIVSKRQAHNVRQMLHW